MRQPGKGSASKDESAKDIERTLIEIADFDSVRCTEKRTGGGVKWIQVTAQRDGKTVAVWITKGRMDAWKRKCDQEGKFTSIAYPVRDRLNEKLERDE